HHREVVMRHYAKQAGAVGFLVFLGLWIIGAARGLTLPYPEPPPLQLFSVVDDYSSSGRSSRDNPNWANNLKAVGMENMPLPKLIDQAEIERIQIHEKTATLTAGTFVFDKDEANVRAALATHKASTISEKSNGIAPQRRLSIEVGV